MNKYKKSKVADRSGRQPEGSFFVSYYHMGRGGRHAMTSTFHSFARRERYQLCHRSLYIFQNKYRGYICGHSLVPFLRAFSDIVLNSLQESG